MLIQLIVFVEFSLIIRHFVVHDDVEFVVFDLAVLDLVVFDLVVFVDFHLVDFHFC